MKCLILILLCLPIAYSRYCYVCDNVHYPCSTATKPEQCKDPSFGCSRTYRDGMTQAKACVSTFTVKLFGGEINNCTRLPNNDVFCNCFGVDNCNTKHFNFDHLHIIPKYIFDNKDFSGEFNSDQQSDGTENDDNGVSFSLPSKLSALAFLLILFV